MSKNVTIDIGGVAQNFPNIESVILNNIGDGQSKFLNNEDFVKTPSDAVQGNVVVFGEGGAIADSGISASKVASNYVFIYDETKEHNDHNRALATQIRTDLENGKKVSVFIDDTAEVFPASLSQGGNNIEVIAYTDTAAYKIKCYTYSANVTYTYTDTYSTSGNFDESSSKPASQKLTAEWVKQLIDDTIVEGAW
jgi:hypothetical protein